MNSLRNQALLDSCFGWATDHWRRTS